MEMGLAEVHQTLVRNELRERVVVRVDGGVRRCGRGVDGVWSVSPHLLYIKSLHISRDTCLFIFSV